MTEQNHPSHLPNAPDNHGTLTPLPLHQRRQKLIGACDGTCAFGWVQKKAAGLAFFVMLCATYDCVLAVYEANLAAKQVMRGGGGGNCIKRLLEPAARGKAKFRSLRFYRTTLVTDPKLQTPYRVSVSISWTAHATADESPLHNLQEFNFAAADAALRQNESSRLLN